MKIKWKHKDKPYQDISNMVQSVTWSGSASQVARMTEIAVINAPEDKEIKPPKIALGDIVKLEEEKELIFYGQVQSIEKLSENGTITISCSDLLSHLLRSNGVYNFKNTTAEQITRKVCGDIGIQTSTIISTGVPIKKLICDDLAFYDIIMKAYRKAARQTGKKYICRMDGKKLTVKEKGTKVKDYILSEGYNITSATYQETNENMVNVVKIYDDKGKLINKVENKPWMDKFGTYQQVYRKEKGVNATTAAKHLLNGIEKKVNVEVIQGNIECIAGNAVQVSDKATSLKGLFWIEGDTHTWESGQHSMSLELNFKNIM